MENYRGPHFIHCMFLFYVYLPYEGLSNIYQSHFLFKSNTAYIYFLICSAVFFLTNSHFY